MRYELSDYEWIAIKPMLPGPPMTLGNMRELD
jgi:transposase